jgi:hypothetical protein
MINIQNSPFHTRFLLDALQDVLHLRLPDWKFYIVMIVIFENGTKNTYHVEIVGVYP